MIEEIEEPAVQEINEEIEEPAVQENTEKTITEEIKNPVEETIKDETIEQPSGESDQEDDEEKATEIKAPEFEEENFDELEDVEPIEENIEQPTQEESIIEEVPTIPKPIIEEIEEPAVQESTEKTITEEIKEPVKETIKDETREQLSEESVQEQDEEKATEIETPEFEEENFDELEDAEPIGEENIEQLTQEEPVIEEAPTVPTPIIEENEEQQIDQVNNNEAIDGKTIQEPILEESKNEIIKNTELEIEKKKNLENTYKPPFTTNPVIINNISSMEKTINEISKEKKQPEEFIIPKVSEAFQVEEINKVSDAEIKGIDEKVINNEGILLRPLKYQITGISYNHRIINSIEDKMLPLSKMLYVLGLRSENPKSDMLIEKPKQTIKKENIEQLRLKMKEIELLAEKIKLVEEKEELRKKEEMFQKMMMNNQQNIIQTNQNEIPNQEVDDISDFFDMINQNRVTIQPKHENVQNQYRIEQNPQELKMCMRCGTMNNINFKRCMNCGGEI